MRNSLRTRLTFILIALAVVPLLLVGIVLAQRSFAIERKQALDLQNQIARQASAQAEASLRAVESDLLLLGSELRNLGQPDRGQQLGLLLGKFSSSAYGNVYEELTLLDNEGQEVLRLARLEVIPSEQLINRAGSDEFEQAKATGETYFGPVQFDDTGEPFMSIAIPLFRLRSVQLDNVLVAKIRFRRVGNLRAAVQESESQTSQTVYMIDSAGRVVAHQDSSFNLQGSQFNLAEQEAGSQTGLDGTEVVLGTDDIQLGEQVFTVVAETPEAEALQQATSTVFTIVVTILISLAVAITLGFLIVRQIVRPIEAMAGAAQAFSAGDLSQQVVVKSHDELGALAGAFNVMAAQLRSLIGNLEKGIQERTQALETSIDVSRQLATILDLDELLQFVVERIQTEFDFYHTHIYLVEMETGDLVMTEGSGEVGRQLKAKGHRLPAGQGIVGTVASTNRPFMSNNVDEMPHFLRNPLLLDTRAELAVPLRKGEQVLGVLDIQSEQLNRFRAADAILMQAIADQTAVAIDNARLLAETQAALEEVEHLNRRLTGEVWEQFTEELQMQGFHFSKGITTTIAPDSGRWLPPMKQAITKRQLVKQTLTENGDKAEAELAVPLILRNEVIGVLGIKREETPDWADEELAAVEAVADQIARALENARLSKEQEKTIDQLREVDRLKSEFLTSMSHELRTPLNSIIGFADVLLQGIDGEINDIARNDIQLIYSSGHHLLALINDILDLSKIEAGQMELVREPISVKESIYEALAATSSLFKDRPIEILADVEDNIPPVYADKLRFNQIVLNLISNAAKFTAKGSVTVKARIEGQTPEKVNISVIDTGIGIPPDKLPTIFDRFRQADSSTTREYGGSGLGLAICKQLVELHGGEIDVRSEVGNGSEFYFTMPLVDADYSGA